ncbi:unnamed protein product [Closterium sp. NIES-64]|nr:unnamed protein product [Closterium sp. NIES-64]CAI6011111.1 unnamed protein product [Closterium sp. NIES-65]
MVSQGSLTMPSFPFAACKRVDHPLPPLVFTVSLPLHLSAPRRLLPNRTREVEAIGTLSHRATVLATSGSSATEFRSGPSGSGSALLQRAAVPHAAETAPIAWGADAESSGGATAAEGETLTAWQQGASDSPPPPSEQRQEQLAAPDPAEGAAVSTVAEGAGEEGEAGEASREFRVESGKWRVRMAAREEMKAVADLQAEVFHDPPPAPLSALNAFFLDMFKAELYDNLLHKLKYSPPDRHCILVAQHSTQPFPPPHPTTEPPAGETSKRPSPASTSAAAAVATAVEVVGVVDLTALDDRSVLKHLSGAQDYLYLSGMAVHASLRRESIASVLLGAVEQLSLRWGFEYIVLHVHEDNIAARRLYQKAGYLAIDCDSRWTSTLLGMRRRVLLAKRTNGYLSRAAAATAAAAGVAEMSGFVESGGASGGTSLCGVGGGEWRVHGVAACACACGSASAVSSDLPLPRLEWQPSPVCS